MNYAETIKENISMRDVCNKYNIAINRSGFAVCPFHNEKTASMKIYPRDRGFHCFGCGVGGDIISFVGKYFNLSFKETLAKLNSDFNLGLPLDSDEHLDIWAELSVIKRRLERSEQRQAEEQAKMSADYDYTEYYRSCRDTLLNSGDGAAYINSRGISFNTAARFWVGFDPEADPANAPGASADEYKPFPSPRVIIPVSKTFFIARSIDDKYMAKGLLKMNPRGSVSDLFNRKALYAKANRAVYLVEGVFDALSIAEAGGDAVALCSTSNAEKFLDAIRQRPTNATIILALDQDESGKETSAMILDALNSMDIPCQVSICCGRWNDPNEALCNDRDAFCATVQAEIQVASYTADANSRERLFKYLRD